MLLLPQGNQSPWPCWFTKWSISTMRCLMSPPSTTKRFCKASETKKQSKNTNQLSIIHSDLFGVSDFLRLIGDRPFFHHTMQFWARLYSNLSNLQISPPQKKPLVIEQNIYEQTYCPSQASQFFLAKSTHLGGTTHPTPSFLWLLVMLPHQSPNSLRRRLRTPPPSAPQQRQREAVPRNLGWPKGSRDGWCLHRVFL